MELQSNSHHVFRLMYHFIWMPKYHHKICMKVMDQKEKSVNKLDLL